MGKMYLVLFDGEIAGLFMLKRRALGFMQGIDSAEMIEISTDMGAVD